MKTKDLSVKKKVQKETNNILEYEKGIYQPSVEEYQRQNIKK